jgi:hypothetical protein
MDQERADYAEPDLPPPARFARRLLAIAVGVGTFLVALVVGVVLAYGLPVATHGTDSKADFGEWISAVETRILVAAGVAALAGIIAGAVTLRRGRRPG